MESQNSRDWEEWGGKKKIITGHHVCKKNNYAILTASAIKGSPARLNEVPIKWVSASRRRCRRHRRRRLSFSESEEISAVANHQSIAQSWWLMLIEEDEDEEDCHYPAEGCHVKNVGDLTIYYNNFCIMATAVQQPPPPPPPPPPRLPSHPHTYKLFPCCSGGQFDARGTFALASHVELVKKQLQYSSRDSKSGFIPLFQRILYDRSKKQWSSGRCFFFILTDETFQ